MQWKSTTASARHRILAGFLALAGLLAPANIVASSAQTAAKISIDQIFSVTTGDWNKDGTQDVVIMIETEDQEFDVLFYLTDEYHRLKLHDHVKAMVWGATTAFGREPWVSTRENGSILIGSQNSAFGRNRWEEQLTVVYRDNQFIVAGYSYSYYDTLDLDANGECDLNLLTGKGTVDDKAIRFDRKAPSILNIAEQSDGLRDLCTKPE